MNKVFIIAEVGINHNGDIDIAKQLIKLAKDCEVDAVKFQKRDIDSCYTVEELNKYRESPWGTTNRKQKEGLELTREEYDEIDRYCKELDIPWSASAWDIKSVRFLEKYDLPFNKIPSARLGHIQLVDAIARQNKLTYISTGMATLKEIEDVVSVFNRYNTPFELMHCNSQYPMPDSEANLLCMDLLKNMFHCKIGFSDHAPGLITSLVAVALGATSIEKHITLNRTMYGSDQAASVEPNGLRKLVEWIRVIPETFGEGRKINTEEEWKIRAKLWKETDIII